MIFLDIFRRIYSTPTFDTGSDDDSSDDDFFPGFVPSFNTDVLLSSSKPDEKPGEDKTETTSTIKVFGYS